MINIAGPGMAGYKLILKVLSPPLKPNSYRFGDKYSDRKGGCMPVQCCVCLSIKEGDSWLAHHEKIAASHGYCPRCLEEVLEEIRVMKERQASDTGSDA